MVRKYFGTDGIRGKANEGAMTAETALRVGMAAGRVFRRGDHRHRVVIGKDTRLSGYMLEPALTAGFTSMGMDVFLFGPLPTTGTVAKLAMRQPFVLFKGLTFQKLCLPGAFRPGDHHNKMLRPGLCVVHASPQYL
ncbi:hypothetical protein [Escherichia coli]|uniref:hypothetical protein n=1 Tax=Escherichia coli TaxID=562 RepID=UPI0035CCF5F2